MCKTCIDVCQPWFLPKASEVYCLAYSVPQDVEYLNPVERTVEGSIPSGEVLAQTVETEGHWEGGVQDAPYDRNCKSSYT